MSSGDFDDGLCLLARDTGEVSRFKVVEKALRRNMGAAEKRNSMCHRVRQPLGADSLGIQSIESAAIAFGRTSRSLRPWSEPDHLTSFLHSRVFVSRGQVLQALRCEAG